MKRELLLFVRPPRPLWPFNGPGSAFWPPLAFASLAAAVRTALPDLDVAILDAPAVEMGWQSLQAALASAAPTYVGIGEEAVSSVEGLRLAALVKELGARVIAGGCFFSHVAPQVLATGLVDCVVHGEGEETLVELLSALRCGGADDLRRVAGISFLAGGQPVTTPPREPMPDLDRLPMPAYDLLPMEAYGRRSRNHPHLAAIEFGRGCPGACDFCVLWRQMGRHQGSRLVPYLRTKSPERVYDEILLLTRRFGRRYLGWVDPCWNAQPSAPARLAEMLLRSNLRPGQSAWIRPDFLVRDAASGALEPCVRAGLNEAYLGIERPEQAGLRALGKPGGLEEVRAAFRILRCDYPQVFRVGSFIYGLPGDTPATMRAMFLLAHKLDLDMAFYIPLTPLPGTPYWRQEVWDGSGAAFREFDFLPRVDGDAALAELTRALYRCFALVWPLARFRWALRGLWDRDGRRRSIIRRHTVRGLRFAAAGLRQGLARQNHRCALRFPVWYER
jgi:radical SAM superfamily enzyme YgiQ (UPF0313 family)